MFLHCSLFFRFVICLCLVGITAAKCDPEICGSMNVSYPFWINNSSCGYPGFQITCRKDNSTGNLAPFFNVFLDNNFTAILDDSSYSTDQYYKIMKIDYTGYLIIDSTDMAASSCPGSGSTVMKFSLSKDGPFTISRFNRFVVVGCNTTSTYTYGDLGDVRCVSPCYPITDVPYCRYGCCETIVPDNWQAINITSYGGSVYLGNDTVGCGFSTIFDPSTFTVADNRTRLFWRRERNANYGLRLNWGIGLENCSTAKATGSYSCSINAECNDSPTRKGHVCTCLSGYQGNGYSNGTDCTDIDECSHTHLNMCVRKEGRCHNLAGSYNCSCANGYKGDGFRNGTGCTDIDECSRADLNKCVRGGGKCHNLAGSYSCSCADGYVGDGFRNGTGCIPTSANHLVYLATIGSVSSFVVVALIASLLVWWLKKRHLKLVEAKYFQQLQQYIASRVGRESLRMFSLKELARASNNYSNEMVLGSGGFGIVFKGILLDGTVVAIKKSNQAFNLEGDHDFLNEVTILSQINHRNIVKLLGCCVQTKFPLLVSEFVPNGTLFEHLHSKTGYLPWASRLQIAIETAEALAYLHSGASQPIFHRDVKSSNILLNESFSPKIADFGISRLISASNNTHLTTKLMGTWGYLDPEYFQTHQLTEKSDVYSFGVVLVELLTALKPISEERDSDEWSLSSLFLSRLNHNRLIEILDSKVLEEEKLQQMEDMASLARECLHLERRKRPSMKEVVEELIWVRGGTRKANFHDTVKCEQTNISREALQSFRSYTFPSAVVSTSEEPFAAFIKMSTM